MPSSSGFADFPKLMNMRLSYDVAGAPDDTLFPFGAAQMSTVPLPVNRVKDIIAIWVSSPRFC